MAMDAEAAADLIVRYLEGDAALIPEGFESRSL